MISYNLIQHVDVESQGSTEPVTVAEVKSYLRINSADESDPTFNEDALILELITTAREDLESFTGLHLITKTLKVTLTNYCGRIEIPGPVVDVTTVTAIDKYTNDITSLLKWTGVEFPRLIEPTYTDSMILTYDVGYTELPKSLKTEILRKVAHLWNYRGDDNQPDFKYNISSKYIRTGWLQ